MADAARQRPRQHHIRTPRGGAADLGNLTALRNSVLSSIVCTSQHHCVAVGISVRGVAKVPTVEAVANTMFGIAATTSDGGVHWASFSLSTRIETAPELSCPSANSCVRGRREHRWKPCAVLSATWGDPEPRGARQGTEDSGRRRDLGEVRHSCWRGQAHWCLLPDEDVLRGRRRDP